MNGVTLNLATQGQKDQKRPPPCGEEFSYWIFFAYGVAFTAALASGGALAGAALSKASIVV